jgi:hypothetical protein
LIGVESAERTWTPANVDPTETEDSKFFFVLSIEYGLLADIVPSTLTEPVLILVISKNFYFWFRLTAGSLIRLIKACLTSLIFVVKLVRSRLSNKVKLN